MNTVQKNLLLGAVLAFAVMVPALSVLADTAPQVKVAVPSVPYAEPTNSPDSTPRPLTHGGKPDGGKPVVQQGYVAPKAPDKNPYEGKKIVYLDRQDIKKPARVFSVK